MKPYIGIKQIWYGDVIGEEVTASSLHTWLGTATEVKNSHQDTWGYTQDDPSVSDYINELTGETYYRDITSEGNKTISFTMGEYAYEDKAELQGGEVVKSGGGSGDVIGWKAPQVPEIVNKAIVGKTKTGNYVVFTNAGIVGKANMADKNIGLGVTAVAMANKVKTVANEYWLDGDKVDAAG